MSFEVEVRGRADGAMRLLLGDVVGASSIRTTDDATMLAVVDQAALVSVIAYLNDVGVRIEHVRRLPTRPPTFTTSR